MMKLICNVAVICTLSLSTATSVAAEAVRKNPLGMGVLTETPQSKLERDEGFSAVGNAGSFFSSYDIADIRGEPLIRQEILDDTFRSIKLNGIENGVLTYDIADIRGEPLIRQEMFSPLLIKSVF